MKKLAVGLVAGAVAFGYMALPVLAASNDPYSQPGYYMAINNTACADHGSFGYFDGDTNLGTNSLGPGTPAYHNGAKGQDLGATGYKNSHLCGNPQN